MNGTLANMPAFAKAFSCKPGDAMVRPDADRCVIWQDLRAGSAL